MAQDAIGAIPRQRYYNNQMLFAADFVREQAYGSALRQLQTRTLFTPGVLAGLGVANGAPGTVRVAAGAAVDGAGTVVLLVDRATLNGTAVPAQGGAFVLDLSDARFAGDWLLAIQFAEVQDPADASQFVQSPALSLLNPSSAPSAAQISLARLRVTPAPPPPPPPEGTTPPPPAPPSITVDASVRAEVTLSPSRLPKLDASAIGSGTLDPARIPPLDASAIASGTLDARRIPALPASAIGSGTFDAARIPSLPASAIGSGTFDAARIPTLPASAIASGTFDPARIPSLPASAIGSGTFDAARIPSLPASAIGSGTLDAARIPSLPASAIGSGTLDRARIPALDAGAITTGTLAVDRIPDLPASKIIGGSGGAPAAWARALSFWPEGTGIGSRAVAASPAGFFVGLLQTDTDQGRTCYALGIGFAAPLLSFDAPELAGAGILTGIFPDRTRYRLPGGRPDEKVTEVRFVGVAPERSFSLLEPEGSLPVEQQGQIAGVVAVGTAAADLSASPPVGIAAIVQGLRDAVPSFSFAAATSPDATPIPPVGELARTLRAEGWTAAEAAPALAAVDPALAADADGMFGVLQGPFRESMATVAQAAWALSAAGAPAAATANMLGRAYSGTMGELAVALAGAYPPPSLRQRVARMQAAGTTARDAAPELRQSHPPFAAQPLSLGVLLRLAFAQTAGTPLQVAQAFQAAGYPQAGAAQALPQLFPTTAPRDVADAARQAYGG